MIDRALSEASQGDPLKIADPAFWAEGGPLDRAMERLTGNPVPTTATASHSIPATKAVEPPPPVCPIEEWSETLSAYRKRFNGCNRKAVAELVKYRPELHRRYLQAFNAAKGTR